LRITGLILRDAGRVKDSKFAAGNQLHQNFFEAAHHYKPIKKIK
jgi:hypothetical protein